MNTNTTTNNAAGATQPADSTAAAAEQHIGRVRVPDVALGLETLDAEVRIYVGTYRKYNEGSIKGAWLDLSAYADQEDFLTACRELHSDEKDPELMFQTFEGFPRCWYEESSAPPAILWEWMEMKDEPMREAFGLYAENMGGDVKMCDFENCYQGTADSEADFAENLTEGCGDIPKDLPSWIVIDWKKSWDSGLRFDYWAESGESGDLHFFRNI